MVRIYDDSLSGGTLEFKISEPGTLRYQIDNTASYADASAMDAASGSAELTGSVAAPVGSGTEVIDTSGLAGGLWYIHLVQGATSDSDVVSVSFTKIANTIISVPTGTYTLSGHNPTVTVDVANIPIDVDLGTYTLTGHGPNLTLQRVVSVDAGSYALTGHAPTTSVNRGIAADAGSYALSGNAPIITFNRQIAAAVGSYTLTGHAPTITVAAGTVTISPAAGSYTLTGHAPTITVGGGAFTPADLFSASQNGAYYLVHPDNCYTDAAKTTNAVVDDAVYVIADLSGNGNDLLQPTASERGLLKQDASLNYYVEFATDDDMGAATIFSTSYTQAFAGYAFRNDDATGTSNNRWSGLGSLLDSNPAGAWPALDETLRFNDGFAAWDSGTYTTGSNIIHTLQKNGAVYTLRQDGTQVLNVDRGGGEADRDNSIHISHARAGRFYAGIWVEDVLTSTELSDAETWLADANGVTL